MRILLFSVLLLLQINFLFAQGNVKVEGVNRTMSQGEQPGFAVVLPKADVKLVESNWAGAVQGKSKNKPAKEIYSDLMEGKFDQLFT